MKNKIERRNFKTEVRVAKTGDESRIEAVSYTHLDVYKRQVQGQPAEGKAGFRRGS